MSASFYRASLADRDMMLAPARAIEYVSGQHGFATVIDAWWRQSQRQRNDNWLLFTNPDSWQRTGDNYGWALLMNGTTSELQDAFRQAAQAGVQGFWSQSDQLIFWFVRRKIGFGTSIGLGTGTKSVVLVAPLRYYLNVGYDPASWSNDEKRWYLLGYAPEDDGFSAYKGYSINDFIMAMLPYAQGAKAWF